MMCIHAAFVVKPNFFLFYSEIVALSADIHSRTESLWLINPPGK